MLRSNFISVRGTVGYGKLEINKLGFTNPDLNQILGQGSRGRSIAISAHAPSRLLLSLHKPARVFGFLNCSARLRYDNPVSFWVNTNWLGNSYGPGDAVVDMALRPGDHLLEALCRKDSNESRHSMWSVVQTTDEGIPFLSEATTSNTCVMTIGSYPDSRIHSVLQPLASTARKQRIALHVLGRGEPYINHYHSKIDKMVNWLHNLPASHTYVLYIDGRDCICISSLAHICQQFNTLAAEVVVSVERNCFPIRNENWRKLFPHHPSGRRWINAGVWMGRRDAVTAALIKLRDLHTDLAHCSSPSTRRHCSFAYRRYRHDDQFLWQAAFLSGLFRMKLDYDAVICANMGCADRSLPMNRQFHIRRGTVVDKQSGARPGILHFSGRSAARHLHQWAGYLGAFH